MFLYSYILIIYSIIVLLYRIIILPRIADCSLDNLFLLPLGWFAQSNQDICRPCLRADRENPGLATAL